MVFSGAWAWHLVQTLTSWVMDSVVDPSTLHRCLLPASPCAGSLSTQSCLGLSLACGAPCLVGSQGNRPLQHRGELLGWAVLNKS